MWIWVEENEPSSLFNLTKIWKLVLNRYKQISLLSSKMSKRYFTM